MSSVLQARLAQAMRPVHGPVPTSAEAVLFADPAELLACLASDVSQGTAATHWWWRGLFPGEDLARTVVAEWMRQPEYVPATLELGTRRGESQPVLELFTEDEARTLLTRVVQVHGLPGPLVAQAVFKAPVAGGDMTSSSSPSPAQERAVTGTAAAFAPWEPWAPEVRMLGLGRQRQTLLGVALMLRRAPTEVRRPSFVAKVMDWRDVSPRTGVHPLPRPPTRSVPSTSEHPAAQAPISDRRPTARRDRDAHAETGLLDIRSGQTQEPPAVPPAPHAARPPAPGPATAPGLAPTTSLPPEPRASTTSRRSAPAPAQLPSSTFPHPPGRGWGLPISTQLGGVFYLVNLSLFLELYGDFTQPARPGLPLSVWDFVALLGRRLLTDPMPTDPVWSVLARLSSREPGEAPSHAFEPPDTWRIPAGWLSAFRPQEATEWTWGLEGGRLRVRHSEGFLVLDVPCEGEDAEAQVQRETAAYSQVAAFTLARTGFPLPVVPEAQHLEQWLGWLEPYVRARLARALGLVPDDAEELERTLLLHEARLHVTESHVDVVFALSQLPLAVRIAGLDRNIGWIPAAGRHLFFHFE
ncbi:hypothetical protein [Corallococcus coralloides]|uniref:hypothetical protein n=1 Tax=Corallococcus coralloides TaxID=184914 RepID=UPI0011D24EC5|nr:hypothetical protein [Corallococcus coralloides]